MSKFSETWSCIFESVLMCVLFRLIVLMNSYCNMLSLLLVETGREKILFILVGPKMFCFASMKNIEPSYIQICFGVNQHYIQSKSIINTSIQ